MDSNQKRFIEDALDLLNELDEGLLQLEANPQASAPLEQVFRTMHTIKGGANMFGFENIGELAHHLETLYDLVRQGKTQVNDGLISITLDGTHPLVFIIQDLEALGTAKTFFYKKENGEVAHWDIFLATTTSQAEIESYFLFVENECQVSYTRLLPCSLFESEEFTQFIEQFNS